MIMAYRGLNENKILAYAEFYDYYVGKEEENKEKDILAEAKNVYSADDLFKLIYKERGILDWKGVLRIKHYFKDENYWDMRKKENFLKEIKTSGQYPLKNKDIVRNIGNNSYRGVSFPIASTIVYFFSERNCPIIDVRAVETLQSYGYKDRVKDSYDWVNYFNVCFEIIHKYGISFRTLDKALWIYPDIKNHLLKNCKKLSDLNITCEDLPQQ